MSSCTADLWASRGCKHGTPALQHLFLQVISCCQIYTEPTAGARASATVAVLWLWLCTTWSMLQAGALRPEKPLQNLCSVHGGLAALKMFQHEIGRSIWLPARHRVDPSSSVSQLNLSLDDEGVTCHCTHVSRQSLLSD